MSNYNQEYRENEFENRETEYYYYGVVKNRDD